MIIRELVQPEIRNLEYTSTRPRLKSHETLDQAFSKFAASGAEYLEVFENGKYVGILPLIALTESLLNKYHHEHEQRYQFNKNLSYLLTKLKSHINKAKRATTPVKRIELIDDSIELIEQAKKLLG